jgi:hypothetical protein
MESALSEIPIEVHPFLVGWCNDVAPPSYQLPYACGTVAFLLVVNTSYFRQRLVLPCLRDDFGEQPGGDADHA